MTEEEEMILKTDSLGRVRMPKERREGLLDAFERSGMSGQAFAKRIGVKYPTFASWIQERRRRCGDYAAAKGKTVKACGITLVEAVVESDKNESGACGIGTLEVETADGLKFHIRSNSDVALAAGLLRALSEAKKC